MMADLVLLDNDVVLKTACFSLEQEMLEALSPSGASPSMLGVGRYVVTNKIDRSSRIQSAETAKAALGAILKQISFLEPDESELAIAADFEAEARRINLELDGGESQLLAILINRSGKLMVTGDKRAIRAISVVGDGKVTECIGCFEQLIAHLVLNYWIPSTRDRVCAEPNVDRAISICFSCTSDETEPPLILNALTSYIESLRKEAPKVLVPGEDFSILHR